MASSISYTNKTHFPSSDPNSTIHQQRKSCNYFFCKSLLFLMFLFLLPLFPSQAPDFVNLSLLTKYWELFHLLFIGIFVSYGLFSTRNVHQTPSTFVDQQFHFSKMFQLSSFFDDSMDGFTNFNSPHKKLHYSLPENIGYENLYEFDDTDNAQVCKSRYAPGGSVVVVAEPDFNSGESGSVLHYKPLGLPVRSLRSNLTEPEDVVFDRGSDSGSGSGSKNSFKGYENCGRSKFDDNCLSNLEEKFDEDVVTSFSPFQCHETSGKKVMREKVGNASHFRPLSIDETQFESLKKSRSLHSTMSLSSQTSSSSSSSTRNHRKMSSLSNISSKSLHSRQYSVSSLSEDSRGYSEDHDLTERENPSECNESVASFLNSDRDFASISKVASRGKSVRTIRANAVTTGKMKVQEMYRNQFHNVGKKFEEAGSVASYMTDGMEFEMPCIVNNRNLNPGNSNRFSKMTISEINKQKKDDTDVLLADIEDNSESDGENIHESSDEEVVSSVAGDSESGAHEVDKKAGEFITKFREQIMLQKMASISRSRGGSFSSTSSYFG